MPLSISPSSLSYYYVPVPVPDARDQVANKTFSAFEDLILVRKKMKGYISRIPFPARDKSKKKA